ncbi:MAG: DUF3179 domain-containing protein [Planctomycetaceae bacterium]|nr:DUF3179 domain-containing protein [Planctomycetaceae bacterium]MBT6153302.1 DUF3179 domain-containing protein [Planctomycetaceae bacterium]MBT6483221.1 DUF3179 domain-containing protein [Planctomycetaceae bacterium]MBT6496342.1 DUF3179 domain-containing protein [Planctomycetaceae bacterium]
MSAKFRQALLRSTIVVVAASLCSAALLFAIVSYQEWRLADQSHSHGEQKPMIGRGNAPSPETFDPQVVVPEMPPITKGNIVVAEDVAERVTGEELVIGVVIDGKARAYPINMLTGPSREIFNDELAGRSIAATW